MLLDAFILAGLLFLIVLIFHANEILYKKRRAETMKVWVKSLRLNKMLEYLGASLDAYVRHVPPQDIEHHILRCHGCKNIRQCDACLRDRQRVTDMHFCPNYDSLLRYGRQIAR